MLHFHLSNTSYINHNTFEKMNEDYKEIYITTFISYRHSRYLYTILNYFYEDYYIVFLYITFDLFLEQLGTNNKSNRRLYGWKVNVSQIEYTYLYTHICSV